MIISEINSTFCNCNIKTLIRIRSFYTNNILVQDYFFKLHDDILRSEIKMFLLDPDNNILDIWIL